MFKRIFGRGRRLKKKLENIPRRNGEDLKACCLGLSKDFPPLADSNFYTTYLNEVML